VVEDVVPPLICEPADVAPEAPDVLDADVVDPDVLDPDVLVTDVPLVDDPDVLAPADDAPVLCPCNRAPQQAIPTTAHTMPIAIRRLTRCMLSEKVCICFLRSLQTPGVAKTFLPGAGIRPKVLLLWSVTVPALHTIVLCLPGNRHCAWSTPSVRMTVRTLAPFWSAWMRTGVRKRSPAIPIIR
jgi:hypothetical protein